MLYSDIIRELISVSPRFADNEAKAAKIIKLHLDSNNVPYKVQPFTSYAPVCVEAKLIVDGQDISCLGSSCVSGSIPDAKYLISHFGYSGEKKLPYNIAYNPAFDAISVVDHFDVPSVTISRKDVIKLIMAKSVEGYVKVNKTKFETENILVGNLDNPANIIFAHFDSIIGDGAIDNAAAVALLIKTVTAHPEIINQTLCVFAGNEEVSYDDYPTKSGYGFRILEQRYPNLLLNTNKVIVIDGIGMGKPYFSQTALNWALQVRCIDKIRHKLFWLQNDQSEVLKYFHSRQDIIGNLKEEYIESAQKLLLGQLP